MRTALALAILVCACGRPDYGTPTTDTWLEYKLFGGMSGQTAEGILIAGDRLAFTNFTSEPRPPLDGGGFAQVMEALEDAHFLDEGNHACDPGSRDDFTISLAAHLPAGDHEVTITCNEKEAVTTLVTRLKQITHFDTWLAAKTPHR